MRGRGIKLADGTRFNFKPLDPGRIELTKVFTVSAADILGNGAEIFGVITASSADGNSSSFVSMVSASGPNGSFVNVIAFGSGDDVSGSFTAIAGRGDWDF